MDDGLPKVGVPGKLGIHMQRVPVRRPDGKTIDVVASKPHQLNGSETRPAPLGRGASPGSRAIFPCESVDPPSRSVLRAEFQPEMPCRASSQSPRGTLV